ncbi:MAG TPA: PEGA domain-containing protein [Kofleriaceae bacterium]|nr:PEGA domain-containing protein [Kofleriaceae bacterium]
MLARRVIALSSDKALGRKITAALKAAGGAVDVHATLDELGKTELQAALVVVHLDGELAGIAAELLQRLVGDTRVIAVLPRTNLAAVVDIMQASERLAGMIVAEELHGSELSAMATRVLAGDIFGLEKLVPWGTLVHSQLVGDYQDKSLCIAQISEFAEAMGVRRKYRESIEQCCDEMLMNALYDAPVDDEGKQIFAEIPTRTRISLRVEQRVVVQYACDDRHFALSVRDAFGTLERGTVLQYLAKCLHQADQIDRKAGGAGLGLYLMVNSATVVLFNVLPGIATEAVCVFDLEAPKLQLREFGFFTEKIDAAGRLAAGPSRKLPAGTSHPVERRQTVPPAAPPPRGLVTVLAVAIVAMFVLIGIAAWPRLFGPHAARARVTFSTTPRGAAIEIEGKSRGTTESGALSVPDLEAGRAYPVVARLSGYEAKEQVIEPHEGDNQVAFELAPLAARVELESQPTGAAVDVDGKPAGTTPFAMTTLPPSSTAQVHFAKPGYRDATVTLAVPGPGKEMRLVQPLAVADELARVKLASEPPGAQVVQNGQLLAGVTTPAEVLVEAGKPQRFVLTMPHKVPVVLEPVVAERGSENLERSGKLVDGADVAIESNVDAKVTVAGAPHCKDLALPATCTLAPGNYFAEVTGPLGAHATHPIAVAAKPVTARFEFGFVQAAAGKTLRAGNGANVTRAAFEVGTRSITVTDDAGTHAAAVKVVAGATVTAE